MLTQQYRNSCGILFWFESWINYRHKISKQSILFQKKLLFLNLKRIFSQFGLQAKKCNSWRTIRSQLAEIQKHPKLRKLEVSKMLKTYYRSLWFPFQHHQSQSATNPSYKNPQTIEEGSQERLLKVFSIVILIVGAAHSLITLQLVSRCRWISPHALPNPDYTPDKKVFSPQREFPENW